MFWLGISFGYIAGVISALVLVGVCAASGQCSEMEDE